MTPSGCLSAPPWRDDEKLSRLLDLVERSEPGRVRFVGGCVRDALLGKPVAEFDLAVRWPPAEIAAILSAGGVRAVQMARAYGVFRVVLSGRAVEFCSLRRDVSTDGRHAQVTYTESWELDARRRDFRCNAVYADRDGTLFDPVGGIGDIGRRQVVFIGDPAARIREDRLRSLRFFRFCARMSGEVDPVGLRAVTDNLDGLERLSAERVRAELFKLLLEPHPIRPLHAMIDAGVLARLLRGDKPAAGATRLEAMLEADDAAGLEPDPLLRLLVLCTDRAGAGNAARRLKLSKRDVARIAAVAPTLSEPAPRAAEAPEALYWHGTQTWCDRIRLAWAAGGGDPRRWMRLLACAEGWQRPRFPLRGTDLVASGFEPGPRLGATLKRLERDWVSEQFAPGRSELLARAAREGRRSN